MTFALSMRAAPSVSSYADAERCWANAKPFRDAPERRRIRDKERSPMHIERIEHRGEVHYKFVYHDTPVVAWCSPERVLLCRGYWASRSTEEFANNFLPPRVHLTHRARLIKFGLGYNGCSYRIGDAPVELVRGEGASAGWRLSDESLRQAEQRPFTRTRIDRKKTRAALLKWDFYEYAAWYGGMAALDLPGRRYLFGDLDASSLLEHLKLGLVPFTGGEEDLRSGDPARYPVGWWRAFRSICGDPEWLRQAIYSQERCYYQESTTCLTGYIGHTSWVF